jgi:PAS domain S-box-containing protein
MTRKKPQRAIRADAVRDTILESISDGVFTVDHAWRITSFNRAAEEITGVPREEAIGRRCSEVFRASMCERDCALRQTTETGKPVVNKAAFIIDAEGRRIPISISTAVLRNKNDTVIGGVETFRDLTVVEELRKELEGRSELGDIVSQSRSMRRIFDILPQVAASDTTVLIEGETGTGKELLARAIHNMSPRKDHPFVATNCGALPDTLLESELFGYRAGAFTGAGKDKPGRFALAEGGTILLDEIGDVSPALQVRLLRVLQDKTFEPLGGTKPVKANVRVVAASNRDLAALVKEGLFRKDLFYRVNVVRIHLPPLRERKEDIPLLVERFIAKFNRVRGKNIAGVSDQTLALLIAHEYPGNIRELENIIEHAFVLCPGGLIEPHHLSEEFVARAPLHAPLKGNMSAIVKAVEAQALMEALKRNQFNRLATAQELGIHKSTLFRKLKALGIELPDQDGRTRRTRRD